MIRVAVGGIYHFGIYVSDEEVIQFGLPPVSRVGVRDSDVEVLSSNIDSFLAGGFLEVCEFDKKEKKKNRTPDEVVDYARSKIGKRGYNILYNNCEHFANECVNGVQICRQAEDLRAMFRKIPVVDVYIAQLPEDAPDEPLACEERMKEIESVSNERVKREKYYVWKLLCYALERSFGMRNERLRFKKESCGAWSVQDAEISISHSEGALAVAVSRAPVGIDIEAIRSPKSEKIVERVMTSAEEELYNAAPEGERDEEFIRIWTAKEAMFKSEGSEAFDPKKYDSANAKLRSDRITVGEKNYIWSVATETPERVRVFTDIRIK